MDRGQPEVDVEIQVFEGCLANHVNPSVSWQLL